MNKENTVIILKNLPSNLMDEAIIIVKDKKKARDIIKNYNELSYKNDEIKQENMKIEEIKKMESIKKEKRRYVVKEAETLVTDYIRKIDDNLSYRKIDKLKKSYKKIKVINILLILITIVSVVSAII